MTEDIIRFMDEKRIVMATIGGHGYGAKVAAATAIGNMNRFTGLIQYEGGPLEHDYYEAYQELVGYIQFANSLQIGKLDLAQAQKAISENILDKNWARIFKEALVQEGSNLAWKINIKELDRQTRKFKPDISAWSQNCGGLWPGQTLALFAANSRWVHLSTNTLRFYNVFPRLQDQFPQSINIHATDLHGPETHWLHNHPEGHPWELNQRMARFLKWQDGTNVMLADKSEAGWFYVNERTGNSEHIPEHVHHNYLYTDEYEKSRAKRGMTGANHGQFLPPHQLHPEGKW